MPLSSFSPSLTHLSLLGELASSAVAVAAATSVPVAAGINGPVGDHQRVIETEIPPQGSHFNRGTGKAEGGEGANKRKGKGKAKSKSKTKTKRKNKGRRKRKTQKVRYTPEDDETIRVLVAEYKLVPVKPWTKIARSFSARPLLNGGARFPRSGKQIRYVH